MQRRLSTTKSRVNHAVSCTSQRKGKKKAVVTTISVVPQTSGRPTPTKYHTAETTLSERHRPNTEKIDNTTAFVAGLAEKKEKETRNAVPPGSTKETRTKATLQNSAWSDNPQQREARRQKGERLFPTVSPPFGARRRAARGDDACRALSSVPMAVVARVVMLLLLTASGGRRVPGLPHPHIPRPATAVARTFTRSQHNPAHKNVS